jgi:hypothetical protein
MGTLAGRSLYRFGHFALVADLYKRSWSSRCCRDYGISYSLRSPARVEFHGMLAEASGDFFTSLPSLPDGAHVRTFSMTFRDNDANHYVTATLERRHTAIGGSVASLPQVKSTNANPNIRKESTQAISNRTFDTEDFACSVRVSLPAGNTIELVKLDVDLRVAC